MAYHSKTNGQIEVVSWSLGDLVRCLLGEHLTIRDLVLPMVSLHIILLLIDLLG